MTHHTSGMTLVEALVSCANLWCDAHDPEPAPLARLGRLAVGDGGFFTRLPTQTKGTTTDTLERFARFLLDPANWPAREDGARVAVPQAARDFAHRLGVSLSAAGANAGTGAGVLNGAGGVHAASSATSGAQDHG